MSVTNEQRIFAEFDSERNLRDIKRAITQKRLRNINTYGKLNISFKKRFKKRLKHLSIEWIKAILFFGFIFLIVIIAFTVALDMNSVTWEDLIEIIEQELNKK